MDDLRKDALQRYLTAGADALLWKLDGLSEYDARRPLVPTGTNLLGLVKHMAFMAGGYFGSVFDRPLDEVGQFFATAEENDDLWVPGDQSRDDVLGLWDRAWAHAHATIDALPLDARGQVPWWPADRGSPTLHDILVHVTAETHRHAGHADIVRELIDGQVGMRATASNLPDGFDWPAHVARVEAAARQVRD